MLVLCTLGYPLLMDTAQFYSVVPGAGGCETSFIKDLEEAGGLLKHVRACADVG